MAAHFASFKLIIVLLSVLVGVNSWLSCYDTFCQEIRRPTTPKASEDTLDYSTVIYSDTTIEAQLTTESSSLPLRFQLSVAASSTFRLLIEERNRVRHRVPEALDGEFPPLTITSVKDDVNKIITVNYGNDKAVINCAPFKVEFYNNNRLVSVANAQNRLVFQTAADKFAVALDVSFHEAQRAYGIPEHAERLALRTTTLGLDPYRHFNLDYGSYNVISTESLYGAIPVLYAHGTAYSSGVFWLNSAQSWFDLTIGPNQVDALFMSQSGALEMFVFTGPTLKDAVKQYVALTGVAPLPQYFALGYHQSRYSYMTQTDVVAVVDNFDASEMPIDVMWLDIDYTQDKKYFTWDRDRFPEPLQMLEQLSATNRKLVAIIDPHIKVDGSYFLHVEAASKGYYVKERDAGTGLLKDYVGECWPGISSYLDFFNPDALSYYASLYTQDAFNHKNIHVWNDMNEPAVFNNPDHEQTMSSELIHYGNLKHRDVHNIYGFHQTIGTRRGLLARTYNVRPFILTRSHFAGIQRYAAIWTGDNRATWEYLQISFPMCLTEALAGVSFCGADVGGFGGIPDDELFQRWYQAGAWLPFYRGHSAIDVPRREPYQYVQEIKDRVKVALDQRYAHLPVWYTLFWEHEQTGEPVIRPITYHYPSEADALSIDNEILVGANILAAPVLQQGVSSISVYLPGGESEVWYNTADNYQKMNGSGYQSLSVNLDSVPVFYRGGSIISRKDIPRKSSTDTHSDPFTLYICPDNNNQAEGTLYVDDYESFKYQTDKSYLYIQLAFDNGTLVSNKITNEASYDGAAGINQVIILNPPANVTGVIFTGVRLDESLPITVSYSEDHRVLVLNDISANTHNDFTMVLISNSVAFKISGFALIAVALRILLI